MQPDAHVKLSYQRAHAYDVSLKATVTLVDLVTADRPTDTRTHAQKDTLTSIHMHAHCTSGRPKGVVAFVVNFKRICIIELRSSILYFIFTTCTLLTRCLV